MRDGYTPFVNDATRKIHLVKDGRSFTLCGLAKPIQWALGTLREERGTAWDYSLEGRRCKTCERLYDA